MKISSVNNNQNNFKGIHFKPKGELRPSDFLYHPIIRQCAQEHEVLVKTVTKYKKSPEERPMASFPGIVVAGASPIFLAGILASGSLFGALMIGGSFALLSGFAYATGVRISKLPVNQYLIQAGEGIKENIFGKPKLTGRKSKTTVVDDILNIDVTNMVKFLNTVEEPETLQPAKPLAETINHVKETKPSVEIQEPSETWAGDKKLVALLDNQNELPNCDQILSALTRNIVTATQGRKLEPEILIKIPDLIKTEENKAVYEKILETLHKLYDIDYNVKDETGISFFEKVLNSENFELLELLKGKKIDYHPELDYAYEQIENPEFKNEASHFKLEFRDLREAVRLNSAYSLHILESHVKSPFFNAVSDDFSEYLSFSDPRFRRQFLGKFKGVLPRRFKIRTQIYIERNLNENRKNI